MTKPFGMDELLARLRAALRRAAPAEEARGRSSTGDFSIDLAAKRVTRGGDEVRLTPTEWHLVEVLVRNRGKLVTQRQLLDEVWGPRARARHELPARASWLRCGASSSREPAQPRYFMTEPGMGYRFELD